MNNPLTMVDPSGLCPFFGLLGCGGGGCDPFDPSCGGGGCDPLDPSCFPTPCIYNCGVGGGGGGGGPVGPPPPTPIPQAPVDVGSPADDPGFGSGPIWTEQIPIGAGPINPWLIIQNFTTTANGTVIGSFPGEQLCLNGVCLAIYWNQDLHAWTGEPPFIQRMRQPNLNAIENPTPPPPFEPFPQDSLPCIFTNVTGKVAGYGGAFLPGPLAIAATAFGANMDFLNWAYCRH